MTTKYRVRFGYRGQPYIDAVTVISETENSITYKGRFDSEALTVTGKKGWFFCTPEEAKQHAIGIAKQRLSEAQENLKLAESLKLE